MDARIPESLQMHLSTTGCREEGVNPGYWRLTLRSVTAAWQPWCSKLVQGAESDSGLARRVRPMNEPVVNQKNVAWFKKNVGCNRPCYLCRLCREACAEPAGNLHLDVLPVLWAHGRAHHHSTLVRASCRERKPHCSVPRPVATLFYGSLPAVLVPRCRFMLSRLLPYRCCPKKGCIPMCGLAVLQPSL